MVWEVHESKTIYMVFVFGLVLGLNLRSKFNNKHLETVQRVVILLASCDFSRYELTLS